MARQGRIEQGVEGPARKIPEHEAIYRRIRDAILFGELIPGQAVTIQGLARMIGAGMTPVREAIRRLTSEGALRSMGNRRIVIPRLTLDQLEELRFARVAVEPRLAEMAAGKSGAALAGELKEMDDALNAAIAAGSVEGYLCHNFRFHFHLYKAADAHILLSLAQSLWLRASPSLRVVCGRYGTANLPDMHDHAIHAIACGDLELVRLSIEADINQGIDQIRRSLIEGAAKDGD